MSELRIPDSLDINFLYCLFQGLKADIDDSKNRLGFSSHQYCKRKVILSKILGKNFEGNVKTCGGDMYQHTIEYPKVLELLKKRFSEKFGIKTPYALLPRQEAEWEILPDRFIRIHPDLLSVHYVVEIKTTSLPVDIWKKELASYQMAQLNGYCGYYKQPRGILHAMDVRVFLSNSKKKGEDYWKFLWNKYEHNIP